MLEEHPELNDLKDSAHVYAYWNVKPKKIVDSDGKKVMIYRQMKRILPLSTHAAEVLRSLGAEDKIAGVSTYINYFPELKELSTAGSAYMPDYEAIISLHPDVVFQFSGWTPEMEDKLRGTDIAVIRFGFKMQNYTSEVSDLGYILDKEEEADQVIGFYQGYMDMIGERIDALSGDEKPEVYLEWDNDYQTDTKGSLHQLCTLAGGINIAAHLHGKNPTISEEWVMVEDPDIIVKFPFTQISSSHKG